MKTKRSFIAVAVLIALLLAITGCTDQLNPFASTGGAPTDAQVQSAVDNYLKSNPGATEAQVKQAVTDYFVANPPPGGTATSDEIKAAVDAYFVDNPPKQGGKGDTGPAGPALTKDQIQEAFGTYVKEKGLPAGQKLTPDEQQAALKEFFAKNPDVLKQVLTAYFKDNPVAGGATPADLDAAVARYVKANQIAKGERGEKGETGAQGSAGPPGKDAVIDEAKITAIITSLLAKTGAGKGDGTTTVTGITGLPCRGDKIATSNEVNAAGPQRKEIGGGGVQHVDYYPDRGVKTISYIVPPQKPYRWMGFGSIWQWDSDECKAYDHVKDAVEYAKGRLDEGHSGIVIDLRGKEAALVGNVANLTEQQIKDLLAVHNASRKTKVTLASFRVQATGAPAAPAKPAGPAGCPPAQEKTYTTNTDVQVTGPAIVHPWWNTGGTSFGQEQVRVKILAGQTVTLLQMQGKVYTYQGSPACEANLNRGFDNANFPEKTLAELTSEGLVK